MAIKVTYIHADRMLLTTYKLSHPKLGDSVMIWDGKGYFEGIVEFVRIYDAEVKAMAVHIRKAA